MAPFKVINIRSKCIVHSCIQFTFLSSYFPYSRWSPFFILLSKMHAIAASHCLNPGVKGLKPFTAIKRAGLSLSLFLETQTHQICARACVANKQSLFSVSCVPLLHLRGFVVVSAVQLKMEHGTSACTAKLPPLKCGGQCDSSMSFIEHNSRSLLSRFFLFAVHTYF